MQYTQIASNKTHSKNIQENAKKTRQNQAEFCAIVSMQLLPKKRSKRLPIEKSIIIIIMSNKNDVGGQEKQILYTIQFVYLIHFADNYN